MTTRETLDRLIEEMYRVNCASLSAPLLKLEGQVVVIRDQKDQIVELVNPTIEAKNRLGNFVPMPAVSHRCPEDLMPVEYAETCYEMRHHDGRFIKVGIERPGIVRLRATDANGDEIDQVLHGYISVAVQHEIDHLNGVKLIDRVGRMRRKTIEQKLILERALEKYLPKDEEVPRVPHGRYRTSSRTGRRSR